MRSASPRLSWPGGRGAGGWALAFGIITFLIGRASVSPSATALGGGALLLSGEEEPGSPRQRGFSIGHAPSSSASAAASDKGGSASPGPLRLNAAVESAAPQAAVVSAPSAPGCDPHDPALPSFWALGRKHVTDKVTLPSAVYDTHSGMHVHAFQYAYAEHLLPRRCEVIRFLEVGLGCGMPYGEGHSVPLWLELLPFASLTVMEFNSACVDRFRSSPVGQSLTPADWARLEVVVGDMTSSDDLSRVSAARGPFDVVVDDGGHNAKMQITTMRVLLPLLRPGGLHFVEDLHMAWTDRGRDGPGGSTGPDYIDALVRRLHRPSLPADEERFPDATALMPLLRSISCFPELCVLARWREGEREGAQRRNASRSLLVVTACNGLALTRRMLQASTFPPTVDVAVYDDASTDGTREEVERTAAAWASQGRGRLFLVRAPAPRGLTAAWAAAWGDFRAWGYSNLVLTNNDVVIPRGSLAAFLAALEAPGVEWLGATSSDAGLGGGAVEAYGAQRVGVYHGAALAAAGLPADAPTAEQADAVQAAIDGSRGGGPAVVPLRKGAFPLGFFQGFNTRTAARWEVHTEGGAPTLWRSSLGRNTGQEPELLERGLTPHVAARAFVWHVKGPTLGLPGGERDDLAKCRQAGMYGVITPGA
jgi:hypothetical protein